MVDMGLRWLRDKLFVLKNHEQYKDVGLRDEQCETKPTHKIYFR